MPFYCTVLYTNSNHLPKPHQPSSFTYMIQSWYILNKSVPSKVSKTLDCQIQYIFNHYKYHGQQVNDWQSTPRLALNLNPFSVRAVHASPSVFQRGCTNLP